MIRGIHSAAFWWPTCAADHQRVFERTLRKLTSSLLGDISIKLSGFAILNMKDSTLNCDPRVSTEKKSTPKTRANSLQEIGETVEGVK